MNWFPMLASGPVTLDNPVVIFASVMLILLVAPLIFERLRIPGTVGLLYLMFLAGLEINAADFRANRTGSLVFGGLTFAVPMARSGRSPRPTACWRRPSSAARPEVWRSRA